MGLGNAHTSASDYLMDNRRQETNKKGKKIEFQRGIIMNLWWKEALKSFEESLHSSKEKQNNDSSMVLRREKRLTKSNFSLSPKTERRIKKIR